MRHSPSSRNLLFIFFLLLLAPLRGVFSREVLSRRENETETIFPEALCVQGDNPGECESTNDVVDHFGLVKAGEKVITVNSGFYTMDFPNFNYGRLEFLTDIGNKTDSMITRNNDTGYLTYKAKLSLGDFDGGHTWVELPGVKTYYESRIYFASGFDKYLEPLFQNFSVMTPNQSIEINRPPRFDFPFPNPPLVEVNGSVRIGADVGASFSGSKMNLCKKFTNFFNVTLPPLGCEKVGGNVTVNLTARPVVSMGHGLYGLAPVNHEVMQMEFLLGVVTVPDPGYAIHPLGDGRYLVEVTPPLANCTFDSDAPNFHVTHLNNNGSYRIDIPPWASLKIAVDACGRKLEEIIFPGEKKYNPPQPAVPFVVNLIVCIVGGWGLLMFACFKNKNNIGKAVTGLFNRSQEREPLVGNKKGENSTYAAFNNSDL